MAARALRVASNKRAYKNRLDAECVRLGLVRDGVPNLRALAERCHLSETTLEGTVTRKSVPRWDTLKALEEGTGVLWEEWLLEMRETTPERLARVLGNLAPPAHLSVVQRRLLRLADRFPPEREAEYAAFVERMPGLLPADTDRGPDPTP